MASARAASTVQVAASPSRGGRFGAYSAFAGLAVGAFVGPLDGSMVNSMLPILTQQLGVEISTTNWLLTIYMLIQTGMMLTFGRLGDLRGHKLIYVGGLSTFMIGSVCSGFATTAPVLIACRAVTALGSAAIWANSAAILTHSFPSQQRGRVLGLQSMMVQFGNSCGPPLGGLIAGLLGWRAIFWIPIPVTLVALGLSLRFIKRDEPSGRGEPFDVAGAVLYVLGLMAVLIALNQGHAWGWASLAVLGGLALGVALLTGFVVLERRLTFPMLDLNLFRERAFAVPVVAGVLNFICTSSIVFLTPLYLLLGRGLTPAEAGLILITQPLVMASLTILSGSLSDRIGSRIPATVGMVFVSLGLFMLSRLGETTPVPIIVASLATVGVGVGLFNAPNSSAVMGAVPGSQRGVAAALLSTARTLGNTLGLGIAGAIFTTVLAGQALTNAAYVVPAVSAGFATASVLALVGAVTSASRPATVRDIGVAARSGASARARYHSDQEARNGHR
jgi:EmrB/QacA subfamily drug resistance transporter